VGGLLTYGFLDDLTATGVTTDPLNRDQVLNLRRATEGALWRNTYLSWRPLDASKWYYVSQNDGTTNALDRFETPCTLVYVVTDNGEGNGTLGYIDVSYVIEFAGAATTVLQTSSSSSKSPDTPSSGAIPGYVSISKPLMQLRR
jgi:hypothetical protein